MSETTGSEILKLAIQSSSVEWQPAHRIMPGIPEPEGPYGTWVKVLRRPSNGGGWTYMLRHLPPPGRAIRVLARATSHEEIFRLQGGFGGSPGASQSGAGMYVFNPAGLVHGGVVREESVALAHMHGDLDEVIEYQFIDA